MDPTEALKRLRMTATTIEAADVIGMPVGPEMVDDFVAQFRALDAWLSKGGFRPEQWSTYAATT